MRDHLWRCSGRTSSSSISDRDGGKEHRRSRPRDTDEEMVAGAAAGRQGGADRNERQKHKKLKRGVGVAIKNEGGVSAITVGGSRGAAAGAAWCAGDVIHVSENSGGGEPTMM